MIKAKTDIIANMAVSLFHFVRRKRISQAPVTNANTASDSRSLRDVIRHQGKPASNAMRMGKPIDVLLFICAERYRNGAPGESPN